MGFEVKKIITEDSDDIRKEIASVVLLMASLLHDSVEEGNYKQALLHLNMLIGSVNLLGAFLYEDNLSDDNLQHD